MIYNYEYFISYAHKDNEDGFVDKFVERLKDNPELKELFGAKPRVFYDKSTIRGMDDWERKIRSALDTSRFMIVLLSPNYFQSEYCAKEFVQWLRSEMQHFILGEGIAPFQIIDVPGLYDAGKVAIKKEAQKLCPQWISELRKRQHPSEFDLRECAEPKFDKAFGVLCDACSDKVWRQDAASNSPYNAHYMHYNENFVGRRELLLKLRDDLTSGRYPRAALHGLGGVGKTELALTYGRSYAWDYQLGRVFVKCENQTSLISAVLTSGLDRMFKVELQGDEEERFAMLLTALRERRERVSKENIENGRPATWGTQLLLILDNVIKPNGDKKLDIFNRQDMDRLPEYVHVVATTQENPSAFGCLCATPVDALTDLEALELLERLRPYDNDSERNAALEIVREFGGHAFRVEKIGAYLRRNKWETYQGFLEKTQKRFEHLRETIDGEDFDLRHEKILDEECLRPTLDKLTLNAMALLYWAAAFGPDSVPVPWLGELSNIAGGELHKALQELEDYRLLIPVEADSKEQTRRLFDKKTKLARLHRIAREIVVDQTPSQLRNLTLERVYKKTDELLGKDESYWLAGDVVWGLDSIADFCYDRYEEAKRQKLSKNDYRLIGRFYQLFELYFYSLRSFDRSRTIGLALEALSLRLVETTADDPQALRVLSASYGRLGDLSKAEGSRTEAREYYEKSLEIAKNLVSRTPDDLQALRDLSFSYIRLGGLCEAEGSRNEAREYYEKAREIAEQLVSRTPDDLQALRDLSVYYERLGDLCNAEGSRNEAREYYEKMLEIRKQLVSRTPDDLQALRGLSISYQRMGDLSEAEGSRIEAREYYEKSLEIAKKLVSHAPDDLRALCCLSASYQRMGDLCNAEGSRTEARECYEKLLEIAKNIVSRTPDDLLALRNLSVSYIKLGDLSNAEGSRTEAREYYEKSLEIFKTIVSRTPDDLEALHDLSVSYGLLGNLSNAEGSRTEAREYYEKAREIFKTLVSRTPDDLQALRDLSVSYEKLGNLCKAEGSRTEAREYYEQSLEIRKQLVSRTPDNLQALRALGVPYDRLGDLCNAEGSRTEAREYYEKGHEIFKTIVSRTPDDLQALRDLSLSYYNLGALCNAEGSRTEAREYYEKYHEITSQLVSRTPDDLQALRDLSISYWLLGKLESDAAPVSLERSFINADAARTFFENGTSTIEKALALAVDPDEWTRDTALCLYDSFGDLERSLGNLHSARKFYEKAEKIADEFRAENNESCEILSNAARNLLNLGDLNYAEKKFDVARGYYERFRTAVDELVRKDPTAIRTQALSTAALYRESVAALIRGEHERARERLETALQHAEELAQKYPDDAMIRRDAAYLQSKLGEAR